MWRDNPIVILTFDMHFSDDEWCWTSFHILIGHWYITFVVVLVQSLSHVGLFVTPWTAACQAPLSSIIFLSLLKFMSIELMMLSNHLILCPHFSSAFSLSQYQSFLMSWLFAWGGQSIGTSASTLPMNFNKYTKYSSL